MSTINREDAIEAIKEKAMRPDIQRNADTVNGLSGAMNIIYDLPTAEKVGKWIVDEKRFGCTERHCSLCGAILEGDDWKWRNNNYCYHCGARMVRGEEDEETVGV